jgi:[glutamine synthetase] adenylyltransferase / [glutamine synthetase]-adenylyl-L-tyrosine phosphorylase
MNINKLIEDAASKTPDPQRAAKNVERLFSEAPELIEGHEELIDGIAKLFSYSQFLADYCIRNPYHSSLAIKKIYDPLNRQEIISKGREELRISFEGSPGLFKKEAKKLLRDTKKDYLLRITLRDLLSISNLQECMAELSVLAEAVIELALDISHMLMREKFGDQKDNPFSIMGLGKLGVGELNYSSDIDILTLYHFDERLSSGVLTPSGMKVNRIYSNEYFCRLTEILTDLLQSPTEDGIAHRVDLRLRPNGQKGALSLSLDSYNSYYESWGKTWERMALIRSKPAAGNEWLARKFIRAIEPFVWKRSLDYNDIEEIRVLKKKIDTIFDVNDIKRGYGGIREIEFFVQIFQLFYGGERKSLRTGAISSVLEELLKEGLLIEEDAEILSESYIFLRRLEHVLQMKGDVRTHSLPPEPDELEILAKKMLFRNREEFLTELRLKRLMVRDMYNSLLGGTDETQELLFSLKDELPDDAIRDYLSFKGFRDSALALKNINALLDQISTGKTLRERTLLRKTIPAFLEHIAKSGNKDKALAMLVTFIQKIGDHESYIDLLAQRGDTREIITRIFSASTYLTRSLISLENLEGIFEYPDIRVDYKSMQERLVNLLCLTSDPLTAIRKFKATEELKSGMLFLNNFLDVSGFSHTLSALADIIIRAVVHYLHAERGFAVVGLGGFGARHLNIGSDLDLMFISSRRDPDLSYDTWAGEKGVAEELIRFLSEYTSEGFAYKVDMRLRPDGSQGVLVNDINGYENYYLKSAQSWEIQSLLRARPIAGDMDLLRSFQSWRRKAIINRGCEISMSEIRDMRKRIVREVSKESSGYDIKDGPGGIKEIEFLVQYLQLKHTKSFPDLIVYSTVAAVRRLTRHGILDTASEGLLLNSYRFLRTVDTILRLNEEAVLKTGSEVIAIMVIFLNLGSENELIKTIEDTRRKVVGITKRVYEGEPSQQN